MARSTRRIARTANVYQYTRLDTKKQQIRLLKLSRPPSAANVLPDRNMIHCELETFDLDTAPEYIALSYTWGDASNNQHIIVGNKAMTIRMNLFDFLYAFRSDDANIRHLWIDQVCSMAPL
jgi:hypothetical protein